MMLSQRAGPVTICRGHQNPPEGLPLDANADAKRPTDGIIIWAGNK